MLALQSSDMQLISVSCFLKEMKCELAGIEDDEGDFFNLIFCISFGSAFKWLFWLCIKSLPPVWWTVIGDSRVRSSDWVRSWLNWDAHVSNTSALELYPHVTQPKVDAE